MRTFIRREKNRRHRPDHRVLPYREYPPPVFDRLEYLTQQLSFALPECIINQILISTDCFLSYAWNRGLFSGKRNAVFSSLDLAHHRFAEPHLSHLIVDMESLLTSRFSALETLRQLALHNRKLHIYLLATKSDTPLFNFLRAAGPFRVLKRELPVTPFRQALLTPASPVDVSRKFPPVEWQMFTALAQGKTMKHIAHLLNLPYHRIVYRLNTRLRQLGLPDRQSLLHLLHRLTIDANHYWG
ncbi:hypothetical protein C813_09295 [Kosakonia sacchari SP1]|uniref:Fimbrial protein FimY n=2 Tax=Kosakonia sacchari TaxID=1158459 RepID=A0A1G4XL19_9ENTR|nr:response regulator transcription factor [Kosakonia sacchari]AHJ74902.1 hypothetical protein C813_09295 [Kosakonia sacchari SP1]SCX41827.1 fimbrial protein FimY [Kosakonia sacchari]